MMAGDRPTVSIAMPAFNAVSTIAETIESVLAQTHTDWELIVVDDGSTDETAAIVESYACRDSRVRLLRQPNAGCGAARATAIEHSRSTLIARLDADDLYLPDYLAEMIAFVESHPQYDIYSCDGLKLLPDGTTESVFLLERYERVHSLTLEDMLPLNGIFGIAVFRRQVYERIGIRPDIYVEDQDFWLRALATGSRHIYLPKALAMIRIGEEQMTADPFLVWRHQADIIRDLIGSGVLTPRLRRRARWAIRETRRWRAQQIWMDREARLASGDRNGSARDFFRAWLWWPKVANRAMRRAARRLLDFVRRA